ncbi:exodeoxyribonuclease III [Megamonas hypermegale]|uniref:exodeoxyribonuclease III n=1 Tax=Megamonas hypermegale TaxID=158847 RepID=UPI00195DDFBD|nr:exodeoxyribonuclease III [Megamonas hypermegale]MBM6761789.1 exodeoxyribonuclease III [Megamonas hypermegale]
MLKFVSWNVNGLRACMNKGFMDTFNDLDADVFCLQETKMQPHQLQLDLPGYYQYWNSADKKGYSGTAIFTKQKPISESYGLGIDEHDHEGRVITLEFEKYYMVCVYTPNSKRELERLDYRMVWEDDFRAYVTKLNEQKPVVICGDLNVAHTEIDLKNPKTNRRSAGFTDEERNKLTELLAAGFTDSFRYLYPDKTGIYSWWSYMRKARENNAGWRIDYFIVSNSLQDKIKQAGIHNEYFGSDHCPVSLQLDL